MSSWDLSAAHCLYCRQRSAKKLNSWSNQSSACKWQARTAKKLKFEINFFIIKWFHSVVQILKSSPRKILLLIQWFSRMNLNAMKMKRERMRMRKWMKKWKELPMNDQHLVPDIQIRFLDPDRASQTSGWTRLGGRQRLHCRHPLLVSCPRGSRDISLDTVNWEAPPSGLHSGKERGRHQFFFFDACHMVPPS